MEVAIVILLVVALIFVLIRAGKWAAETSFQKDLIRVSDQAEKEAAEKLERMTRTTELPPPPTQNFIFDPSK